MILLALGARYGWPCAMGLVLGGDYVYERFRGLDLQRMHDENAPTRALALQQAEDIDRLVPGWSEKTREVHRRAEQSITDALERMDLDLQAVLDGVLVRPDLVEHWSFLGGLPYRED